MRMVLITRIKYGVISLLILSLGCTGISNKNEIKQIRIKERPLEIVKEIDTFKIAPMPLMDFSYPDELYVQDDSILIFKSMIEKHKIFFFNLASNYPIKTVEIEDFIVKNRDITNIIPLENDRIFLILNPNTELMIIDHQGQVIKSWKDLTNNLNNSSTPGISIQANFGFQKNQFDSERMLLYSIISQGGDFDFLARNDEPRFGIFDLKDEKWIIKHTNNQGRLANKKDSQVYFPDMHIPYQYTLNDTTYLTFAIDEFVYLIKTETGQMISRFNSFPDEDIFIPKPIEYDPVNDKTDKLRRTTDYFGPFYYHEKAEIFSRWYRKNDDKGAIRFNLFDRDYNLIDQFKLDEENLWTAIPTSNGYLIKFSPTAIKSEKDTVKILHMKFNMQLP
jgi:hypothetical protein